ncbi:MAG: hypothetical protein ACX939_02290, partial [Hyphococcus sp.]
EKSRAEKGDPVLAWRLARRYEFGDGVAPSQDEMVRWLKVAAAAPSEDFPKSGDAAYRLCRHYAASGERSQVGEARSWCASAAERGDAAAAAMLGRLAP